MWADEVAKGWIHREGTMGGCSFEGSGVDPILKALTGADTERRASIIGCESQGILSPGRASQTIEATDGGPWEPNAKSEDWAMSLARTHFSSQSRPGFGRPS